MQPVFRDFHWEQLPGIDADESGESEPQYVNPKRVKSSTVHYIV